MTEKRQFKRVPLNVTVEATASGRLFLFETRNISVGGLLLRGNETLAENDTFQMKFLLPGHSEPVAAAGVVQHVSPEAFMGVRFTELSDEVRQAIETYVQETPVPQP